MSVINTNISSIQAQNSLRVTQLNQSTAMERLSSGVRINSAKDDAAGLAISTRMTANIRGIAAAVRNANDGISLTQTAEGSLGQISDNLQRIRELAVQSANTGNNASDRAAMNNESKALIAEIDRVASNTMFNGIKLLDGTFQAQALQVGVGNDSNDRINVSISNAKSSSLGNGSFSGFAATAKGVDVPTTALTANDLSVNGFSVGATVTDGASFLNATGSGIAKAAAINAISGLTGVTATVDATTVTGFVNTEAALAMDAGAIKINGVDIGPIAASTGANAGAQVIDRGTQVAATINSKTAQTGVTATVDTAGIVSLSAADGRNITVTTTAAGGKGSGLGTGAAGLGLGEVTSTSTLTLKSTSASGITLAGAAGLTATGLTAKAGNTATVATAAATAGAGVAAVDLTTAQGSQDALATLDTAINQITDSRASMGAYQNRLTASISNLETTSQNLSASRSRIMDTDYAKESTNLAKAQIISQAATAMLAQANQSQQSVLALLK